MDKACGKIFVHQEPSGSLDHECRMQDCGEPAQVFLRIVQARGKETWLPGCEAHASRIAAYAIDDLLLCPSDDDPGQPDLPIEETSE